MKQVRARKPSNRPATAGRRLPLWIALTAILAFVLLATVIGALYFARDYLRPNRGPDTAARATDTPFLEGVVLTLADDAGPMLLSRGVVVLDTEPFVREPSGRRQRVPLVMSLDGEGRLSFTGEINDPAVQIYGTAEREEDDTWAISFVQESTEDLSGYDFGLRFRFHLDSPVMTSSPTRPRVLGGMAWQWDLATDTVLQCVVTAMTPTAEQPEAGVIDLLLNTGRIPADSATAVVRLTASGSIALGPPDAERAGPLQPAAWPLGLIDHDASPVDLRFLNHTPAGSKGFVKAEDGAFVFEDGTPARFWGTNLAAYALFMDKETIDRHAERIARLGYNLVRMHHHDSMRWVQPTVIDLSRDDSRHLDLDAMDRFDYWVAALKERGVYVWLDLHTGRNFKPGDREALPGGVPGFDEIERQASYGTILNYVNPGLQALMAEFNEQFLWHENPYTGTAYADEPAIAGIAITNENNLTGPLANRLLPERGNPTHAALLATQLTEFALRTGQPERAFVRWWEPGPGKLFLNAVEEAFHRATLDQLAALGVRVPIITTQYWAPGIQSSSWALPALAQGDAIAVHTYGKTRYLQSNPVFESNFVIDIAGGQIAGKPLIITEWGIDHRPQDRVFAPLYMAGMGALQGWDGILAFNYAQHGIGTRNTPPTWAQMHDPGFLAMAPASALLYRRGDLSPPAESALIELDEAALLGGVDALTTATIRLLAERMPVTLQLPPLPMLEWHEPSPEVPATLRLAPNAEIPPATGNAAFQRDWEQGILTIDTPGTQAAAGWLGGGDIELSDAVFTLRTPMASVAVSSLMDVPIRESSELLISVAGRSVLAQGRLPFRSEPIQGDIALDLVGTAEEWVCYPLFGDGVEGEPIPLTQAGDVILFTLPEANFTHWFRLVRESPGQ